MKYLKSFENYSINEEEGWKEFALAGLTTLGSFSGKSMDREPIKTEISSDYQTSKDSKNTSDTISLRQAMQLKYSVKINGKRHNINKQIELGDEPITEKELQYIFDNGEWNGSELGTDFVEFLNRDITNDKYKNGFKIIISTGESNNYNAAKLKSQQKAKSYGSIYETVVIKDGTKFIGLTFNKTPL